MRTKQIVVMIRKVKIIKTSLFNTYFVISRPPLYGVIFCARVILVLTFSKNRFFSFGFG